MTQKTSGKIKTPVEIQHNNGAVTFGFVFLDTPDSLYEYIQETKEYITVSILSGDIVYFAKHDIKAFRLFDASKYKNG